MRRIGFYISDFAGDPAGFVVSDLDDLIARGVIEIVEGGEPEQDKDARGGLARGGKREATPTADDVPRAGGWASRRGGTLPFERGDACAHCRRSTAGPLRLRIGGVADRRRLLTKGVKRLQERSAKHVRKAVPGRVGCRPVAGELDRRGGLRAAAVCS